MNTASSQYEAMRNTGFRSSVALMPRIPFHFIRAT